MLVNFLFRRTASYTIIRGGSFLFFDRSYAKFSLAPSCPNTEQSRLHPEHSNLEEVSLNSLFWWKSCSLALPPDSRMRVEEPHFEGIKYVMLKMMLFYSKQSKYIRGANVVYRRIKYQVDKPAIYYVFCLEKTFKNTFALFVLHMWLFLRRMIDEGEDGKQFNSYLYEIYNRDLEFRVRQVGVNLLLKKWMKDLEKIFYGNVMAYVEALKPEAEKEQLENVLWRNVFSKDGSPPSDPTAIAAVQAMARYVRRESACLAMTEKEALFSGNFMFTSLKELVPNQDRSTK